MMVRSTKDAAMSEARKVLVTGATGKQGGAVARALLARGHEVHAVTRNVASANAKALAEQGAKLTAGDFSKPDAIAAAMKDVDSVFAMSTPFEAGEEAEIRQGKALVDAAVQAGVDHFVYTSVAAADRNTGIPHFDSKYEVEQHLAGTKLAWSVVAPVYFMENLLFPNTLQALREGSYASPLPPDRKLQQIAVDDIGKFAAHVIDRRDPFLGKRIDIAGDELTGAEQAKILGEVLGKDIGTFTIPMAQIRSMSEDLALMYEWFIEHGYDGDIEALRGSHPEVEWQRFGDWARRVVPAVT